MGLAGAKRRTKYSNDPNNNAWSKSTDGFGHKILTAQGWQPGQLLGAKNAAQAEHFTAANASHIRVFLREDGLGLGAKLGKSNAETFGLSTLSGIFGRLNGKSDAQIEKTQNAQRDAELRAYQTQKFGIMTFVRGGLLVGDKMEEFNVDAMSVQGKSSTQEQTKSNSKRKRSDDLEETAAKLRKKKHPQERASNSEMSSAPQVSANAAANTKAARRRAKKNTLSVADSTMTADTTQSENDAALSDRAVRKAQKAERRARKEERRKRREERRIKKAANNTSKATSTSDSGSMQAVTPVTPAAFAGGRQALRQRWIQQKRLASLDAKALNEILMLKTAAA